MFPQAERACEASRKLGVSSAALRDICWLTQMHSVPAALQYEKFLIPDALRVVDALVETLSY